MNMPNTMKMNAASRRSEKCGRRRGRSGDRRRPVGRRGTRDDGGVAHWSEVFGEDAAALEGPSPSAPSRVGLGASASRVCTVATTERPGCRSNAFKASGANLTRTATRCTTLVKLPVALSGGSSENCDPEAGAIEAT